MSCPQSTVHSKLVFKKNWELLAAGPEDLHVSVDHGLPVYRGTSTVDNAN
ncbi:MAG: hypothetical protein ACKO44_08000 [Algoriphagus sp.]